MRNHISQKIQAYLAELLGAPVVLRPWPGAAAVPFFLTDNFDLFELTLSRHSVVVAVDKKPGALSPSELAARMGKLRSKAQLVVYATERLSWRERRALIGYKVPFVVPGNQLYLPDLGIDLREYLQRGAVAGNATALKPSAQALLICSLLARPWSQVLHPAAMARELHYTAMTASRAANDLVAAGLAVSDRKAQAGAPLYLRFKASNPKDAWHAAEPILSSPVTRTVWVDKLPERLNVRVAGAQALSRHTMLASTDHPVYAVRREAWLEARKADPALEDLGRDVNRIELQIWSYSPGLSSGDEVDPFSLVASMRDDSDERVQLALNELREGLKW